MSCYIFACSNTDIMAYWKQNIRKYYPELLAYIDTNTGLRGALLELQSSSFPKRAISRIWVMICNFILSGYFMLVSVTCCNC